jgi:predicted nuclease of predicted toxin-antitoxin system
LARFLIDESLPPQLADALRAEGYDAVHVQDRQLAGVDDDSIYRATSGGGFILVSKDLDFADERRFLAGAGLVVVRFRHALTRDETVRRCVMAIQRFSAEIEALESKCHDPRARSR